MSTKTKKTTAAKKAPAKKAATKSAAKANATKKAATKKAAPKKTAAKAAAPKKGNIMTNTAEKTTERAKEMFSDVNGRAKAAMERGGEMVREFGDFQRANVEAIVESGKVAVKGAQDLGKENADYVRTNFETARESFKGLTVIKSPTDFFEMQSEQARKNFDTAVSQASKNAEAMIKLAGEIFQPLSDRVSAAAENMRKAA